MYTGRSFEATEAPSGAEVLMRQARAEREFSSQNRSDNRFSQTDASVDPIQSEQAMDLFFQIQAAWMNRDLNSIQSVLDYDAREYLEREITQLKSQGIINRLENIAVRSTDVVETWQEGNRSYSTIRFLANLLDYTIDEKTQQVVHGNKTQPVKFEEFWTFSKNVFDSQWKLSAIQQSEMN
jgi:predicted lipid-binding transport protein (Tim44 family)